MIPAEHLKIEVVDPQPRGGQHVGAPLYAVRVTHIPSGISAACGTERSQMKNKNLAISMVGWGLSEARLG